MKNPLGFSPSKGYQGTMRGKEKILMTSVGIVLRGTTYICTLTFSSPRFTTLIVPDFVCPTS